MESHEISEEISFSGKKSTYVTVFSWDGNGHAETKLDKDKVLSLRNWLNDWLDTHVFNLPPKV